MPQDMSIDAHDTAMTTSELKPTLTEIWKQYKAPAAENFTVTVRQISF